MGPIISAIYYKKAACLKRLRAALIYWYKGKNLESNLILYSFKNFVVLSPSIGPMTSWSGLFLVPFTECYNMSWEAGSKSNESMVGSIHISYVSVQFYLIIGSLWEALRNKMDPHFCQHLAYLYLESFLQKVKISVLREVMSKDTYSMSTVISSWCTVSRVTQYLL